MLQNLKVGTELQKPTKQNFPKITLQSMDNIWGVVNPNKAGFFKVSFSWVDGGGGGQFKPPRSYFKNNLCNFNISLKNC